MCTRYFVGFLLQQDEVHIFQLELNGDEPYKVTSALSKKTIHEMSIVRMINLHIGREVYMQK